MKNLEWFKYETRKESGVIKAKHFLNAAQKVLGKMEVSCLGPDGKWFGYAAGSKTCKIRKF